MKDPTNEVNRLLELMTAQIREMQAKGIPWEMCETGLRNRLHDLDSETSEGIVQHWKEIYEKEAEKN